MDVPIPFPSKSENQGAHEQENPGDHEAKPDDLGAYREKHELIDTKIKALAMNELENIKNEQRDISPDEELLLQILSQHHQPRKQLILALKSNLIYPNLKEFLNTARIFADIPNK